MTDVSSLDAIMAWLPSFATEWLPSIGVVVLISIELYRFLDRRRRDQEALNVSLSTESVELDSKRLFVTAELTYTNIGPYQINFSSQKTKVTLFEIPSSLPDGPVHLKDLGEPLFEISPFRDSPSQHGEPNSESKGFARFAVGKGKLYVVRWRLRNIADDRGWTRWDILDAR